MKHAGRVALALAIAAGCSGGKSSPMDMTSSPPDFSVLGPYTCSHTIADYCPSPADCPPDVATARSRWCSDGGIPYGSVREYTCGADTLVEVVSIDTATTYVYDATGNLVAVLGSGNSPPAMGCDAGPPQIELDGCESPTKICGR